MEPTLKQLIQHEDKRRKHFKEIERLEKKEEWGSAEELWKEYILDEVCHFIPELSREKAMGMTVDQRNLVMNMVRGVEPEEGEPDSTKKKILPKKKKR